MFLLRDKVFMVFVVNQGIKKVHQPKPMHEKHRTPIVLRNKLNISDKDCIFNRACIFAKKQKKTAYLKSIHLFRIFILPYFYFNVNILSPTGTFGAKSPKSLGGSVAPLAQVAIINCSPLWLKICHWHISLTRRAPHVWGHPRPRKPQT